MVSKWLGDEHELRHCQTSPAPPFLASSPRDQAVHAGILLSLTVEPPADLLMLSACRICRQLEREGHSPQDHRHRPHEAPAERAAPLQERLP
jgi:hypothetical protein